MAEMSEEALAVAIRCIFEEQALVLTIDEGILVEEATEAPAGCIISGTGGCTSGVTGGGGTGTCAKSAE